MRRTRCAAVSGELCAIAIADFALPFHETLRDCLPSETQETSSLFIRLDLSGSRQITVRRRQGPCRIREDPPLHQGSTFVIGARHLPPHGAPIGSVAYLGTTGLCVRVVSDHGTGRGSPSTEASQSTLVDRPPPGLGQFAQKVHPRSRCFPVNAIHFYSVRQKTFQHGSHPSGSSSASP